MRRSILEMRRRVSYRIFRRRCEDDFVDKKKIGLAITIRNRNIFEEQNGRMSSSKNIICWVVLVWKNPGRISKALFLDDHISFEDFLLSNLGEHVAPLSLFQNIGNKRGNAKSIRKDEDMPFCVLQTIVNKRENGRV